MTYDVLRSTGAGDFTGAGACHETDGVDLTSGTAYFYLSRATNVCPQGDGDLGSDSQVTPHIGATCP